MEYTQMGRFQTQLLAVNQLQFKKTVMTNAINDGMTLLTCPSKQTRRRKE